jgi:hypothetical protein
MAEDKLRELIHRLGREAELRERFRRDPVAVVEQHEIELTDDQRERLRGEDGPTRISDEELLRRLGTDDWGFWF